MMKFAKGVMIGTLVSAGVVWMYYETNGNNKKRMMKKGRKILKEMGI